MTMHREQRTHVVEIRKLWTVLSLRPAKKVVHAISTSRSGRRGPGARGRYQVPAKTLLIAPDSGSENPTKGEVTVTRSGRRTENGAKGEANVGMLFQAWGAVFRIQRSRQL